MEPRNPAPVVVGLIFTKPEEIVTVRRKIPPFVGECALPGGYVDIGEDWRKALQREISEEANVIVSVEPEDMQAYDVHSTPDGRTLLIFAVIRPEGILHWYDFKENNEVSERILAPVHYYTAPQLCFPLHTQVVERYRNEHFSFEGAHPGGW